MYIGLQLYGPIANWKSDLVTLLKGCRQEGINMLEPCLCLDGSVNNPSFLSLNCFKDMYKTAQTLGLKIESAHIACEDLQECEEVLCKLADDYGIKHFVVGMPYPLEAITIQERAFVYRNVADCLAEHGARLLIHNGKPDVQVTIGGRTAYEYMLDVCLGKVGMQFDTGWAFRGGADPVEFMKRNMHRIESLHYKDFDGSKDTDDDVCIGKGTLDNEMFMQLARAKGIPQYVDADRYEDVLEDVASSYHYLIDIGQQRAHSVSYLNIYDTETKNVKTIKSFPFVMEAPNWVHGDNYLIYNAEGSIYRYDFETGDSERIETGDACNCNNDHVLSFDEKEIAVSSDYAKNPQGGSRILILPIEGGQARLVTPNAPSYLHGWSPDGEELAYCAFRDVDGENHVDIYTISAEGGEEKRLTTDGFNDGPEYSPDGKHIWFISTRSGLMQLYRMNRDGSDVTQMTFENQNNWFGHVSPNGKKIVNLAYHKGELKPEEHLPNMKVELWMMDYDGNNRERLFEFFGGQGSINVNSWSGDSRYFAFVSYEIVE